MARTLEDAEEDKAGTDRSVENAEEDQGRDHKGERNLLVDDVAERAESRGGVVLGSRISIDDAADERKDEYLGNRDNPESLTEVVGVLHFSDEGWKRNLTYEGIADVEECVHACHKSRSCGWYDEDCWLAEWQFRACRTEVFDRRIIRGAMLALSSGKSCGQNDTDECEKRRDCSQFGKHIERAR